MSEIKFISFKGTSDEFTLLSGKTPEICTFSDFIIDNYSSTYHDFVGFCFKNRLLPLPGNADFYFNECMLMNTEILSVHLNRTDQFNARINTVVRASFSNMKNTYKFRFRIEGKLKTSEKCNFFENIYPFSKKDIPADNLLSDYLVPYLAKKDLDAEAENMLQEFYPEALQSPVPVNARKLAERMGFKIMKARLSPDDSKFGSIFFSETDTTIFKGETPLRKTVPAKTILIDIEAQKNCCINTNDVIVHECVHAYEHYLFFFLQSLYRSMLSDIPLPLEDITSQVTEGSPLQWIENQAAHMTPRIRMPLSQTAVKAAELFKKYEKFPEIIALEKVTADLSEFYDVSKLTARNRLVELGYSNAEHIGHYANGSPVPGYKSCRRIGWDQTYTIDFDKMVMEYSRNSSFREILKSGDYIYVEGHLCINSSKYIWERNGMTCLSGYARNNIDECCLLFTVKHENEDYVYVPGALNREARRGELSYLYLTEHKSPVAEAMAVSRIRQDLPSEFSETIVYHMHNLAMSRGLLAERSLLSEKTISRMRNEGRKRYSVRNIIAVCIGLSLYPELSHDLLEKADIRLHSDDPEEQCYEVMLRTMYRSDIYAWNEMLRLNGFSPLQDDSDISAAANM